MYISQLRLQNIRCYPSLTLDFAPGINLFIGENNSGKSTVLDSLLMLQNQRLNSMSVRYGEREANIVVTLSTLDPRRLSQMKAYRGLTKEQGEQDRADVTVRFTAGGGLTAKIKSHTNAHREDDFRPFPTMQPDNFLIPYLAIRRATQLPDVVGKQYAMDMSGTLNHLQAKIDRCSTSKLLRPKYEEACEAVLGFVVTTFPVQDGKAAGLEIDAVSDGSIRISHMGSGVTQALGLIVELLTACRQVFVIEEVETDLHPAALRSLMRLIEHSVANGCQFFMSTHSNIVLRHLGGLSEAKVFRVASIVGQAIPEATVDQVPNDPSARRQLLSELGYDLSDYELYGLG